MKDTYSVHVTCGNCSKSFKVEIPKGVPFKGYKITCQNCEVTTKGIEE